MIDIISRALVRLGAEPITSFSDGTTESEVSKIFFDSVYEALLSETQWHFATKYWKLSERTTSDNPNYQHCYMLPPDVMYVIRANTDYEIYAGKLYSNRSDVEILYVFKPEIDRTPPYFKPALELRLAAELAVPITGDTNKAQYYTQLAEYQTKKARFTDSSTRTVSLISDSPYNEVRS